MPQPAAQPALPAALRALFTGHSTPTSSTPYPSPHRCLSSNAAAGGRPSRPGTGRGPGTGGNSYKRAPLPQGTGPGPAQVPLGRVLGEPAQPGFQAFLRSRWPYLAAIGLAASGVLAYSVFGQPAITARVALDFEVDGSPAGRVVVGLHGREAPQTVDNFLALASHAPGFGYRGSPVHRLMRGWSVWGGDVTAGDGSGGVGAAGPSFGVETRSVRHTRGTLSMVPDEEERLRSQFFFTLVTTPALDRKAAAFGKVLEGIEVLDKLSRLPADEDGRPKVDVRVRDSQVLDDKTLS